MFVTLLGQCKEFVLVKHPVRLVLLNNKSLRVEDMRQKDCVMSTEATLFCPFSTLV